MVSGRRIKVRVMTIRRATKWPSYVYHNVDLPRRGSVGKLETVTIRERRFRMIIWSAVSPAYSREGSTHSLCPRHLTLRLVGRCSP